MLCRILVPKQIFLLHETCGLYCTFHWYYHSDRVWHQILYDGVRLYNSAHAFGVYSIINSNIIDQAKLHKSGASGSFFGRLSSVMDIRIKDPNLKKTSGGCAFSKRKRLQRSLPCVFAYRATRSILWSLIWGFKGRSSILLISYLSLRVIRGSEGK